MQTRPNEYNFNANHCRVRAGIILVVRSVSTLSPNEPADMISTFSIISEEEGEDAQHQMGIIYSKQGTCFRVRQLHVGPFCSFLNEDLISISNLRLGIWEENHNSDLEFPCP